MAFKSQNKEFKLLGKLCTEIKDHFGFILFFFFYGLNVRANRTSLINFSKKMKIADFCEGFYFPLNTGYHKD